MSISHGMGETAEAARLRMVYDLSCAIAAKTDLEELIPFVMKCCREHLNAEAASVLLLTSAGDELDFPYVSDDDATVAKRLVHQRMPSDRGIAGAALSERRPILVEDAQNDPRFYPHIDTETSIVTRSIIAVPLITRGGALGVLEVLNRRGGGSFDAADVAFLETISSNIAISIENARLYSRLRDSEASLRTQVGALRRDLARSTRFSRMIGTGPAMEEVFRLMESASASMITVLIEGETGTGKEEVARGIHNASDRSEEPFLAVNCAAMPENLLESELFGHRRGAFTGALRDNPGVFRAANGGVVFLDEVADMPAVMQAKLLRVLEQGEVIPVGDNFPVKVDVRVISATNRDLEEAVRQGKFREDLYYRLSAFPIRLPPLRERREDIPLLARRFMAMAVERTIATEHQRKRISEIEPAALDLMMRFDWRGNIRQLRNEIDRAVALSRDGDMLKPEHFSQALRSLGAPSSRPGAGFPTHTPAAMADNEGEPSGGPPAEGVIPLRTWRHQKESQYIAKALAQYGGNVSRAAKALEISRPALQEKMKTYRLRQV
jgi:Nif-specific regulatory protein